MIRQQSLLSGLKAGNSLKPAVPDKNSCAGTRAAAEGVWRIKA
jgi:hypothetical protein